MRGPHNPLSWAQQIRSVFLPQIEAFARSLPERLLPTFAKLEEEADGVEKAALGRLSGVALRTPKTKTPLLWRSAHKTRPWCSWTS